MFAGPLMECSLCLTIQFTNDVNAVVGRVIETINGLPVLRKQLDDRRQDAGATAAAGETIRALRDTLAGFGRRLAPIFMGDREPEPYSRELFRELSGFGYGDMNAAPSGVERMGFATVRDEVERELAMLGAAVGTLTAAANAQLQRAGVAQLTVPAALTGAARTR